MNNDEMNDALSQMEIGADTRDFAEAARDWRIEAKGMIGKPADFLPDLMGLIEGKNEGTPFCFDDRLYFRPGEVTLWVGQNGSGKSMLTGQLALNFALRQERTIVCSFEMAPARTLFRMMRQCMGKKPSGNGEAALFAGKWLRWLTGDPKSVPLMLLSKCRAGLTPDIACGIIAVACGEYGCKHVFVDNLMKVVSGEDNLNGQKNFVSDLTQLAQDYSAHIHLVHHVRKGNSESDSIDKFSVRGTSAITDLVDNILLIERNHDKIKKMERGMLTEESDINDPDTFLRIAKQRNGDCQNALIKLWYQPDACAFCRDASRELPVLCPDWVAGKSQTNRLDDVPF